LNIDTKILSEFRFAGQEDDDKLGFYNFKARLYDPNKSKVGTLVQIQLDIDRVKE